MASVAKLVGSRVCITQPQVWAGEANLHDHPDGEKDGGRAPRALEDEAPAGGWGLSVEGIGRLEAEGGGGCYDLEGRRTAEDVTEEGVLLQGEAKKEWQGRG